MVTLAGGATKSAAAAVPPTGSVTVTGRYDGFDSVTTTVADPPASATVPPPDSVTVGSASSLAIVPVPVPAARPAFVAPLSVRVNVSSGSNVSSPVVATPTALLVSPGRNVSVPAAAA
jgi:hypothetical protein